MEVCWTNRDLKLRGSVGYLEYRFGKLRNFFSLVSQVMLLPGNNRSKVAIELKL